VIKWIQQPSQQQQGAGGIIQQKAVMLIPIAMDPKFYPSDQASRDRLELIYTQGGLACDQSDLSFLGEVISAGCQPGC
jgi:hypothetical protein